MNNKDTRDSSPADASADGGAPGSPGAGPRPVVSLRKAKVHAAQSGRELLDIPALDLFPGERIVVTGPSGSGKSLLLSTLTGRWAMGLRFSGSRTTSRPRIGFIPQRGLDALHPLSPLGRQLGKVTGASAERVAEVLASVGLADPELRRRRPAELSGGQAQRGAVALAVLTEAPLILADEPTSALDHDSRDQTLRMLEAVIAEQQTLVVVTHDPAVADALATRRLVIEAGRITELPAADREPPSTPRGAQS